MKVRTVTYAFHHIGVPTTNIQPDERYSSTFKMYTSGGKTNEFRIQYHRFEEDSPLHSLIKSKPHIAFKVDDLKKAISNKEVILGPYEPFPGFKVAVINECGIPIELIETTLSEEEIWEEDHKDSVIYPTEN
ncbi:VOC family protein [Legionella sp. CNM-1927-20]|uniref:VOC family protein n=1 Tax=Legionella sp. CNM-1927-20 TaxID=3422221 RepID=UPI00403AD91B